MATRTTIEWTQMTWNPVTGCTKIGPGCKRSEADYSSGERVPHFQEGELPEVCIRGV